jgi:hypothetical protein
MILVEKSNNWEIYKADYEVFLLKVKDCNSNMQTMGWFTSIDKAKDKAVLFN